MERPLGDPSGMIERLQKVEQEVRQNRWIIALALLFWVPWLLIKGNLIKGNSHPQVVEAQGFLLKDSNEQIRGALSFLGEGTFLYLYDKNGKARIEISVAPDGPAIRFYDAQGKVQRLPETRGHVGK